MTMDTLRSVSHTQRELGDDAFNWLISSDNLAKVREFVDQQMAAEEVGKTYTVTINYSKSLKEMIKVGEYDYHHSDITAENFPIEGEGTVEVNLQLIHLNEVLSTKEVLAELDKQGMRPATLAELLALGWMFKELQREFPIVALGSVWRNRNGHRDVPYLISRGSDRDLNLRWDDDAWGGHCRFLAVRK